MAELRADAPLLVSFWAIAKLENAEQVAIKFNELRPVLMSVEAAREFAAALTAELEGANLPRVPPLLNLA